MLLLTKSHHVEEQDHSSVYKSPYTQGVSQFLPTTQVRKSELEL